jgi:rhodanese-related sulfurtransferase
MASHHAAGLAAEAGYTNVSVLAEGLMGWKKAGQKTIAPAEEAPSKK